MITSKETYLAFRADWAQQYKALSAKIRAVKLSLRLANRELSLLWNYYNYSVMQDATLELYNLRKQVKTMFEQLDAAKLQAQANYINERS